MSERKLNLAQAVDGFLLHIHARRLAAGTITAYTRRLAKFIAFIGEETLLDDITALDIERYFAAQTCSKATLHSYHNTLSALWTWATGFDPPLAGKHILHQVTRPKPEKRVIEPFTKTDIKAMLQATRYSTDYRRPGQRITRQRLPDAERNEAIILTLLDTGLRCSELCAITIAQTDLKRERIKVMGKGAKERTVRIDSRTATAIWKYLTTRPNVNAGDPLFSTDRNTHIDRHNLYDMLHQVGERAGVPNVHPHRFRHTFAIQFLRNGGNIYALKMILGHETLDMVQRYLKLAQIDLDESHRQASPVANWNI